MYQFLLIWQHKKTVSSDTGHDRSNFAYVAALMQIEVTTISKQTRVRVSIRSVHGDKNRLAQMSTKVYGYTEPLATLNLGTVLFYGHVKL